MNKQSMLIVFLIALCMALGVLTIKEYIINVPPDLNISISTQKTTVPFPIKFSAYTDTQLEADIEEAKSYSSQKRLELGLCSNINCNIIHR